MSQANNLAEFLQRNGFPNATVRPNTEPDRVDDEVTIDRTIHIQVSNQTVGFQGGVVVESPTITGYNSTIFTFMETRTTRAAILADLHNLT